MDTVSYLGGGRFRFGARTEVQFDDAFGAFVVPRRLLEDASVVSLRRALSRAWSTDQIFAFDVWPVAVTHDRFDPERLSFADFESARIVLEGDDTRVMVNTPFTASQPDQTFRTDLLQLLGPLAARRGAKATVTVDYIDSSDEAIVAVLEFSQTGGPVGKFLQIGADAAALIAALDGKPGTLGLETAADLVRSGHIAALIGAPEGPWLDAKRSPYTLESVKQKIELAKDVAAFANGKHGGLIVIGASTSSTVAGDLIDKTNEVDLTRVKIPQIAAIVRERVFPSVAGLEIAVAECSPRRGAAMIYVPPQNEASKPFMVRGAATRGEIHANHLSVPTRVGEDTKYADIAELHALMTAGRAFLSADVPEPDGAA